MKSTPTLADVLNKKPEQPATPGTPGELERPLYPRARALRKPLTADTDKSFPYRMSAEDYYRLKEIALEQRISVQQFITDCINKNLKSKGLPGIAPTRNSRDKRAKL